MCIRARVGTYSCEKERGSDQKEALLVEKYIGLDWTGLELEDIIIVPLPVCRCDHRPFLVKKILYKKKMEENT